MPTMIVKRGFLQILLAALLLVAQYAALTHGLRHWQPSQLAQSQQEEGGKQKAPSSLCDFHVAFAEVLGGVGACAAPLLALAPIGDAVGEPLDVKHTARLFAPLSRGPPVLL